MSRPALSSARRGTASPSPRFSTGGWRGVLGEEFTFERLRALAAALGAWVAERAPGAPVIVAHDTRFLADRAAGCAARVLGAAGLRVLLAEGPLPTPVAARSVPRRRAAAGLIVTASHNPPEWLGLKVIAPWGGSAPGEMTRDLEARAARILVGGPPAEGDLPRGRVHLRGPYLDALLERLDTAALRRSRGRVLFDALHGVGAGTLDAALRRAGAAVVTLRGESDPRFGGGAPDPVPGRLGPLLRAVRRAGGAALGLATDGDADRFAVVDEHGRPLSESAALALLVDHLARSGRIRRGVAISEATGSLVERVAAAHGLAVERHPLGFRHLSRALVEGHADVAGEESGGFAWRPFCVEKDGVLAGCLFAEMAAQAGPVGARLAALRRSHGRLACARSAHALDARLRAGLEALRRTPPSRLDGARVLHAETRDGLRVVLPDGFVLWRLSGTEPVLRVYAEAEGFRGLARRLEAARVLLEAAGRRRSPSRRPR